MFRSRSIKHARLLIRHAEKLIRYRCDVLTETALADIRHQIEAVERSIKQRDLPGVRENSERLDALVAEHSPSHREAGWRENCEVILVAIVVAVGVRSYFIQPFKDRKSTRLNSSHRCISYAVFCLKKKTTL